MLTFSKMFPRIILQYALIGILNLESLKNNKKLEERRRQLINYNNINICIHICSCGRRLSYIEQQEL